MKRLYQINLILLLGVFSFACQTAAEKPTPNLETSSSSSSATSAVETTAEKNLDDFEEGLSFVKTAGFDFTFVFRRADGGVFTAEDIRFLKDNSPRDTNQWILTADGKTVIAGSNYRFMPENLEILKKRFKVENLSKTIDENPANNSNGAKKPAK